MIYSALVNNITFIIALSILYSFIIRRWKYGSRTGQAISGILFGAVAVGGMMNPLIIAPGVIFDGRSIVISIAGFLGGWLTAVIAALMGIIYRAWLGGPGVVMGISVVTSSAAVGIAYHYIRRRKPQVATPVHLIGFGIIVHLCMLAMTLTLPPGMRHEILSKLAMPILLIYPLGTLLVCVVLLDLESRILAEDALRESEVRYRELVENASEAIFVLQGGKLVFQNPRAAQVIGHPGEELRARSFPEFIHPDDREGVADRHVRCMRGEGSPHNDSFRIIPGDGTVRWVEQNAVLIDWRGKPATLNFLSDITERRRSEEALRQERNRAQGYLDTVDTIIVAVDTEGKLTTINRKGCQVLGYEEEDLLGRCWFSTSLPQPEGMNVVYPYFLKLIAGEAEAVERFENPILTRSGERRQIAWRNALLRDEQGRISGILSAGEDITDRRRAEEERKNLEERLQRSEKMEALGKLAGGVAHDLNNVLGVLSGYSELLMERIPEGNPLRQYAANILKSSTRAAAIIQDLLTLARRGVMVSEVVDFNGIVSNLLATPEFERLKDDHPQVIVTADLGEDLLHIKGSAVHLEKTVMNLVANAAEAIYGRGDVRIRTENRYLDKAVRGYDKVNEGDYVVLTVSDSGRGISSVDFDRIFEPFYTKKKMGRSGTGLGLAIVWGTVKDHNGYLDVQSREGQGTTFTLYFPVTRERMAEDARQMPLERYRGEGEAVLVVDDVEEQRQVATTLLTHLGYRVDAVASGEEAVEYLRNNQADIMVLDMIMTPGMDGLETFRHVREINPAQKAILVSGFSETDRVKDAQKLGAGTYVKKPYVLEKIGMAIRDELGRD